MSETRRSDSFGSKNPWPLVLSLVGVDYFSTLAYLPSMAVEAAGSLAPAAAGAVVLVTFLMALPVYWYVVGRSPDGRGATGMLEESIHGWRGKLVVLALLGFAATDFVITRSLSLADATVHLIHNPHGKHLLERLPANLLGDGDAFWQWCVRQLLDPPVAITLVLSIAFFGFWQLLKRGFTHRVLLVTATVVCSYLALTMVVIGSGLVYVARHPEIYDDWYQQVFLIDKGTSDGSESIVGLATASTDNLDRPPVVRSERAWIWAWLSIALWSFPQMALGLSGFEMIMSVVPQVTGGKAGEAETAVCRVRNMRKLMLAAAAIMAVYLMSAVLVTTWLVPRAALAPNGSGQHRALAYLAHGSTLANGANGDAMNPLFGHHFGDIFDLSSVMILGLAGAAVTLGLQNLVPYYLHRLGMELSFAGKVGVILHLLNLIVLLVTVVFQASPSSQQWAYATSVLVLLGGAAFAAAKDLSHPASHHLKRWPLVGLACAAGCFFLAMSALTVLINHSGLTIAMTFVVAIIVSSFVSRWIRSTELRFVRFDFVDETTRKRWEELCQSGPHVLVPHRPGRISLAEKCATLQRDYRLSPNTPVVFVEAILGDPSNFYQTPLMQIEREGRLEVIRLSRCVSVSHALAAITVEFCLRHKESPEIIFGWSDESTLAWNLNFLLFGEGNVPWMVKELVRKALPEGSCLPRIVIG